MKVLGLKLGEIIGLGPRIVISDRPLRISEESEWTWHCIVKEKDVGQLSLIKLIFNIWRTAYWVEGLFNDKKSESSSISSSMGSGAKKLSDSKHSSILSHSENKSSSFWILFICGFETEEFLWKDFFGLIVKKGELIKLYVLKLFKLVGIVWYSAIF